MHYQRDFNYETIAKKMMDKRELSEENQELILQELKDIHELCVEAGGMLASRQIIATVITSYTNL